MSPEQALNNVNINEFHPLPSPGWMRSNLPLGQDGAAAVNASRDAVADILEGRDDRLLVVVGPCSIHDLAAGREYAGRLAALAAELKDRLLLVMRVYFEKPRTTVGWKGFINDPHLDDSFDIETGLKEARRFLLEVVGMGLPVGTEALDPIVPQYIGDLISWYAIGARTTESQTHREMASGLSAPCGFKNGTDGDVGVAINAMLAARTPHHFLGIDAGGQNAVVRTRGNPHVHMILRGGRTPNYQADAVADCIQRLRDNGLPEAVLVDCSHGNSAKDPARQPEVAADCVVQRAAGTSALRGLMIESHLNWGNQSFKPGSDELAYGVSITDACIDWASTEALLRAAWQQLGR